MVRAVSGPTSFSGGELAATEHLAALLGSPPRGEVWVGDDAAVLSGREGPLLFATDLLVEGVHFERALSSCADVGWKALASNLSDLAAMGGRPLAAVVALAGASQPDLDSLYEGLLEASRAYSCPLVGGDLSDSPVLVVSIAVLGTTDGRPPVLRSGARPGERLFVTGTLGAAAAGLRLLRVDPAATGELVGAHRRPRPRLGEGIAAASLGASAMIDLSDGLGLDLARLAAASSVGVALEGLPACAGATEEEALGGGEDYELLFSASPEIDVAGEFARLGLRPPIEIGQVVADPATRTLDGEPLPRAGYLHRL
jgi:thiamine-monophosphate kinase